MFIIKNLFPRTSNYRQEPLAAPLFKLCKGPTAKHSPAGQPWVGNEQPHSAAGQTRPQKSSEGRGQQSESRAGDSPRWSPVGRESQASTRGAPTCGTDTALPGLGQETRKMEWKLVAK